MSTWNYRVVRKTANGEIIFGVHEAFYDDDGNLEGITEDPVEIYAEGSVENLGEVMKWVIQALEAEPIIYEEAPVMVIEPIEEIPPNIMDPPIDIVVIK